MAIDGLSIGLFAGSFNPAHAGHMHVARCGLNRLRLDHIWWMVSPQNPLKPAQPSYESRVASVKALDLPYRMNVSHIERDFGTQYTIDMLDRAKKRWPHTRFVFLMGADNFNQLPKWQDWQKIIKTIPIAVISRPTHPPHINIRSRLGRVARTYSYARIEELSADQLQFSTAPAWTFLTPPFNPLSSSAIRRTNRQTDDRS